MLPKNRRINIALFKNLLKKGRSVSSKYLSLRFLNVNGEKSRFSFVISARVAKKASERNLFKRRGRHIIRKVSGRIKEGFFCAIFAKNGATKLKFVELEKEILGLLSKVSVI